MGRRAIFEEAQDLPMDEWNGHYWRTPDEDEGCYARVRICAGGAASQRPRRAPVARRLVADLRSWLRGVFVSRDPGLESPQTFFNLARPEPPALSPASDSRGRETVDQKDDDDHFHDFHDSELGDVFDLYLAVNGAVRRDGYLDVEVLHQYSPPEAEALNVPRLIEVWNHTKTGCPECAHIINTLNGVRGTLAEKAEELIRESRPQRRGE